MALTATIYRVELSISDIDRSVYQELALRLALHPSEERARLVARLLAFALCWRDGLQFTPDLEDGDAPALRADAPTGEPALWVEVGTPSARKLHRASKSGAEVQVITFRGGDDGLDFLRRELARQAVYRADRVEVIALPAALVADLAERMGRSSQWTVIVAGESLQVVLDGAAAAGDLRRLSLADLLS